MPNNVVRSMVLICDMYVLLEFLYCPIRTVPIFSYIHTSSYLYMLGTIIYIYLFIYVYNIYYYNICIEKYIGSIYMYLLCMIEKLRIIYRYEGNSY